jgi:hypothetical protein
VYTSSITDWIQAIGVILAFLVSIPALFKLFAKDKERSEQIESLRKMAESQSLSTSNLIDQLEETKRQTLLLAESNEILKAQGEFQKSMFLKENSTNQERLDLDKLKRRNEIKPYFILGGSSRTGLAYHIVIKNTGKFAKNITITYSNLNNIEFSSLNSSMDHISNDGSFALKATIKDVGFLFTYNVDLNFTDEENNHYVQKIIMNSRENRITIPEYIKKT